MLWRGVERLCVIVGDRRSPRNSSVPARGPSPAHRRRLFLEMSKIEKTIQRQQQKYG
jgi:hypothetical protein